LPATRPGASAVETKANHDDVHRNCAKSATRWVDEQEVIELNVREIKRQLDEWYAEYRSLRPKAKRTRAA